MRCLVAVDDPSVRDTVAHAATNFGGIEVDAVAVEECRRQIRRRRYDFGLVALKFGSKDSMEFWEKIRSSAPNLPLVGLTSASAVDGYKGDRSRLQLFALLGVPLDVVDLYRTLRRLIDRVKRSPAEKQRPVDGPA